MRFIIGLKRIFNILNFSGKKITFYISTEIFSFDFSLGGGRKPEFGKTFLPSRRKRSPDLNVVQVRSGQNRPGQGLAGGQQRR